MHYPALGTTRAQIIYIHPFAEEMNKSRRMAALQARALAAGGYSVLQVDLQGCGDSSGDFSEGSWQGWIDDILRARQWLHERELAVSPLWLWGLRAGCLLAVAAGLRLDEQVNYCFWQPAVSGKVLLQQFMRTRVAADMMNGASKGLMEELRQRLAAGEPIEIAGYLLPPALALGLERARLEPPARPGRLEWFELSTREDAVLSPVSSQALAQWSTAGFRTNSQLLLGPAFWQTTEIEDAPALIDATRAALLDPETTTV